MVREECERVIYGRLGAERTSCGAPFRSEPRLCECTASDTDSLRQVLRTSCCQASIYKYHLRQKYSMHVQEIDFDDENWDDVEIAALRSTLTDFSPLAFPNVSRLTVSAPATRILLGGRLDPLPLKHFSEYDRYILACFSSLARRIKIPHDERLQSRRSGLPPRLLLGTWQSPAQGLLPLLGRFRGWRQPSSCRRLSPPARLPQVCRHDLLRRPPRPRYCLQGDRMAIRCQSLDSRNRHASPQQPRDGLSRLLRPQPQEPCD